MVDLTGPTEETITKPEVKVEEYTLDAGASETVTLKNTSSSQIKVRVTIETNNIEEE